MAEDKYIDFERKTMLKPFISPLMISWNKLLKSYKVPVTLRNSLLIWFAVGIMQLAMFGSTIVAVIAIIAALR
ncbi:MAG: hypothetical protein L6461_13295 [Anaerolineae bacterium]|nr:hypothetical protein [Anaerolineae bacterium]